MDWLVTFAVAFWAMLPAYVPNNAAVLAGGGTPIDRGRTWRGRRILGNGKTWRGTAIGIITGFVLALVLNAVQPAISATLDIALPAFPTGAALALPTGAMLGDILASFLKRRTGRERGAAFPGLDQLDFAVGALGLAWIVVPAWFVATFTWPVLLAVIILTPVLHLVTNVGAFALGLKNEPW